MRPHTRGVKVIITDPDGRTLVVLHRYEPHWMLPGGGVRRREAPVDAAIREMHEELGLTFSRDALAVLGEYRTTGEGKRDTITLFAGVLPVGAIPRVTSRELREVAWVTTDDQRCSPATARRLREYANRSCTGGSW